MRFAATGKACGLISALLLLLIVIPDYAGNATSLLTADDHDDFALSTGFCVAFASYPCVERLFPWERAWFMPSPLISRTPCRAPPSHTLS